MSTTLLRSKLQALIGLEAGNIWPLMRWANGPLSGQGVPTEGDWAGLVRALCARGPANWVGKHRASKWANDEGSLGYGTLAIGAGLLHGVELDTPVDLAIHSVHGTLEMAQIRGNGLPPLFLDLGAPSDVGQEAQSIYEKSQSMDDNAARALASACAAIILAGRKLREVTLAYAFESILRRLADAVHRNVRRVGGACQFHHPVTGDPISGRPHEPAAISVTATADAMLIMEIAFVTLGGGTDVAHYSVTASQLEKRLRRWAMPTADGLRWDCWVRPMTLNQIDAMPPLVQGVGRDDTGAICPASRGLWPRSDAPGKHIRGVPRGDYAGPQLDRLTESRRIVAPASPTLSP